MLNPLSTCCLSSSSKAVESECFETQGSGSSWVGKVMLYEDSVSSTNVTQSDSDDDDIDFVRWPSQEDLSDHNNCDFKDRELRWKNERLVNDLEEWD